MYDINDYKDATVYDSQGEKVGKVDDLFIDEETGQPEWVLVDTGMLSPTVLVPVSPLNRSEQGFVAPYTKEQIESSPRADKDADTISQREERKLYDHYGIAYGTGSSGTILPQDESAAQSSAAQGYADRPAETSPSTSTPSMSESEREHPSTSGVEGEDRRTGEVGRTTPLVRMSRSTATGPSGEPVRREETIYDTETVTTEPVAEQEPAAEEVRRDMLGEEPSGEESEAERLRRLERERRDDTRAA